MDLKTILYCIPSMGGGGAERQLTYLAAGLVTIGWEVHVAFLHTGPNFDRLKTCDAVVHRLGSRNNHNPQIFWQLKQVIRTVKPDLIQTWFIQMDALGGGIAWTSGIPWILSERASALAYPPTIKNRLRVFLASGASAVVSNSVGGDQYWRGYLKDRVLQYIIPNIVPFEEIDATTSVALPDIDLEPEQKVVLFAGRFVAQKNVDTLIVALEEVLQKSDVIAILCGEGPERDCIQRLLEKFAISDRVLLPGYVSSLFGLFKRADVFVSISLFEGQPNTVLEAAACNCPLVLSDIPEHREFLDEYSAMFVSPHEPAKVAEAITRVLSDPLQAKVRASKARAAVQEFSVENITNKYHQVYQDVLAKSYKRRSD